MSKVSIRLLGGLGNNIFQIACAYAYSLKHNKELVLVNEKFGAVHNSLDSYKNNILHKVSFVNKYDVSKFKVYNEPGFHYQEIPFIEGDVLLNGYFQSELYFKEYEKEIRELFSFPVEYVNSIKEKYKDLLSGNTCSIHVRRGDYVGNSNHPVQSMNYYMRAIRENKECTFLICSDSLPWCRENFPPVPEKFIFIENNTDSEDLLIMSLCCNNILANSSFSWWSSFLNNNEKKCVIAPKLWFGPPASLNYDIKDLIPEGWIKI